MDKSTRCNDGGHAESSRAEERTRSANCLADDRSSERHVLRPRSRRLSDLAYKRKVSRLNNRFPVDAIAHMPLPYQVNLLTSTGHALSTGGQ